MSSKSESPLFRHDVRARVERYAGGGTIRGRRTGRSRAQWIGGGPGQRDAEGGVGAGVDRVGGRDAGRRLVRGRLQNGVTGQRERSYDHCYNYFARTEDLRDDMEKTCAVLGFYLASWGMYRGSTFLFNETNSRAFIPVVTYAQENRSVLGEIDVHRYNDETLPRIAGAYTDLRDAVLPGAERAVTLITKIMGGVFGCVPAYDTYFRIGIRNATRDHSGEAFWRFTRGSLELLGEFYEANKAVVDELHAESTTWRFDDSTPTGARLTRAKILDMYFFDLGYRPDPPSATS
jgi:hypothetical protein